ncbi:hypothetical protein RRG08_009374 [Elysia crispata]|uniref:Uncharacterized protein n=1 Tax=Elysia crispata TaxID=231223 RepID=A0AAE1AFZ4_9GAST|nr:hypothetical protein RRG08_009374 [Elysia crispata]
MLWFDKIAKNLGEPYIGIPISKRDYSQGKGIAWNFVEYVGQVAGILPAILFIVVIYALTVVRLSCHTELKEGRLYKVTSLRALPDIATEICTVIEALEGTAQQTKFCPVSSKEVFQSLKLLTS